jgi:hypothetical protein
VRPNRDVPEDRDPFRKLSGRGIASAEGITVRAFTSGLDPKSSRDGTLRSGESLRLITGPEVRSRPTSNKGISLMGGIVYLVGLVVVVMAVLSLLGLG